MYEPDKNIVINELLSRISSLILENSQLVSIIKELESKISVKNHDNTDNFDDLPGEDKVSA